MKLNSNSSVPMSNYVLPFLAEPSFFTSYREDARIYYLQCVSYTRNKVGGRVCNNSGLVEFDDCAFFSSF